jgi:hypothetical protein
MTWLCFITITSVPPRAWDEHISILTRNGTPLPSLPLDEFPSTLPHPYPADFKTPWNTQTWVKQVYLHQNKKKEEAEGKNCHAKTMLSLEKAYMKDTPHVPLIRQIAEE